MKFLKYFAAFIAIIYFFAKVIEGKGHSYYAHVKNKAEKQLLINDNGDYITCTDIPDWTDSWWDGHCTVE